MKTIKNMSKGTVKSFVFAVAASAALCSFPFASAEAQDGRPVSQKNSVLHDAVATEERVQNLLDIAEQHVRQTGMSGVNDFNQDPRFIDNELYLFSMSRSGYILSSGGWSASLIGQNVLDLTDDEGRPFFQQMLDKARSSDEGSVEYLWFNPVQGGQTPKITHFRVVDDVLIASGYAPEVSTEEEAKVLLEQAVSEYFNDPALALRKFRNKHSEFRNLDQYVFLLNKTERTVVWNPSSPELNGQSLDDVKDIQDKRFLTEIADNANLNAIQKVDYWWFSPITNKVELRRAFYQQVGDEVVAVSTFVFPEGNPSK